MARENLLAIDSQGKVLEGPTGLKPSKETSFHLAVYEVRPDVSAIVHVHPTYATVFAVNGRLIPTVTISAQLKLKQGEQIAVARPGSKDEVEALMEMMTQMARTSLPFVLLLNPDAVLCEGALGALLESAALPSFTWVADAAVPIAIPEMPRSEADIVPMVNAC